MERGQPEALDGGRLAAHGRGRLDWRGRRGTVPSAGGRLDVHRLVGRRIGRPGLHRKLRGDERLLVEPGGDIVALLSRVLVALLSCKREPLVGFGEVLVDADSAGIEDAEIVLAVRDAAIGGLAEPLCGLTVVGLAVDALGVEHREIVDRLGVPLVGTLQIELARLVEVLLYALALFVKAAEAIERGRETLLGGAVEPLHREFQTGRYAAPFSEAHADLVFGRRIAGGRGGAQRR